MAKALFLIVFFVAYTIQAITGFAGNMLCMPTGTALLGFNETVAILNATGVVGCGLVALIGRKHINWHEFIKMTSILLVFMIVGIWLDTITPLSALLTIYGCVILYVGISNLVFKRSRPFPEWALWIIMVLAGLIQGMFVSGGAFLVIYAVQKLRDKDSFRSTISLVWVVLNGIYAVIALFNGSYSNPDTQMVLLLCIPLLLGATYLGYRLQKRISQQRFLKFTFALLTVIGVIVLVSSLV